MTQKKQSLGLPARYMPVVFAFYMSAIMAFLMSLVIVGSNSGLQGQYLVRVLSAYRLAMPVAFICVLFVRPIVMKLVSITVKN